MNTDLGWVPFIAADEKRVRQLEERARIISKELGVTVRLLRFSVREELMVIEPPSDGRD